MTAAFSYVARADCICGQRLTDFTKTVRKNCAWGEICFVRCSFCGSWCQNPQIAPNSLAAWYDSDEYQGSTKHRGSAYVNYLADEAHRVAEARRRYCRDLAAYLPARGRILEIGCATGSLLSVIRSAGHEVVGVDLSPRFADAAKQLYGLEVEVTDILSAKLAESSLNAVLLVGTCSNLSNIQLSLRRIQEWLKPNGTLVMNYPVANSMMAQIYGPRFWMFAPTVSTFMSSKGVRLLLEQAGFSVLMSRWDRQMPSFQKLLNHAGFHGVLPLFRVLGLGTAFLPFRVPVPGVNILWARAEKSSNR